MPATDLFKRTLEAGSSVVGMTRERAEAVVKEWVEAGDLGKAKAQKAVDELLERSRKATADIRALVRREVSEQLVALGVATKGDIARLEAKFRGASEPGEDADTAPGGAGAPPRRGGRAGGVPARGEDMGTTPEQGAASAPTKAAPVQKSTAATPSRGAGEA